MLLDSNGTSRSRNRGFVGSFSGHAAASAIYLQFARGARYRSLSLSLELSHAALNKILVEPSLAVRTRCHVVGIYLRRGASDSANLRPEPEFTGTSIRRSSAGLAEHRATRSSSGRRSRDVGWGRPTSRIQQFGSGSFRSSVVRLSRFPPSPAFYDLVGRSRWRLEADLEYQRNSPEPVL
jgi:hypothetical protein